MTTPELTAAVERLYAEFARYALRKHVEGCPCCVEQAGQPVLQRVPLRKLSGDQLGLFAFKAMTTWGDVEDYKHFLPRILELSSSGEGESWPGFEWWLIAGKLKYAKFESWPAQERGAVQWFARCLWKAMLTGEVSDQAEDVLDLARTLGALDPLE
ncbi:MAG: hypothetical protein AB7K71_41300 [Polyangiaceae bacterium]